ncbi:MAG: nucleoside-diphosphate kinase [Treponema sp.]|jgi:nucleoside diphosphate kinase|nr:nucleoside-diphosphate kinase [Treponema sp.]
MSENLSYVLVTPHTIAKSRTGGVIARLLSLPGIELAGAQLITPDQGFARAYSEALREETAPGEVNLCADYAAWNLCPQNGKRRRSLLLIFKGEAPCSVLVPVCGHLHPEHGGDDEAAGETIRDTYADLIISHYDPNVITYFEPAVITPRNQETADRDLRLFAGLLKTSDNVVDVGVAYPDPSKVEQTLVIIKPDNWEYASTRPGTIISMFACTGLRIAAVKVHRFSLGQALEFYGPVKEALEEKLAPTFGRKIKAMVEREFGLMLSEAAEKALIESAGIECARDQFDRIVTFMSGETVPDGTLDAERAAKPGRSKCMILLYEGENAVQKIRAVLGPTDPLKAPGGTVRRDFGSNVMVNSAHASDSPENARREMGIVRIHENDLARLLAEYTEHCQQVKKNKTVIAGLDPAIY